MVAAFAPARLHQYFAVKALPNPVILASLLAAGSGLDCASGTELELARRLGARGRQVVFTANNTSAAEYAQALAQDALITFDDRAFFDRVDVLPPVVAFRVAPHGSSAAAGLMGDAVHSKFGVPIGALTDAYRAAVHRGATRFGIHGMISANELDLDRAVRAAADVIAAGAEVGAALGITMEYVNIGGGLGIPYRPGEPGLDFTAYAQGVLAAREQHFPGAAPDIVTECGRFVSGPHGVLVTRVLNTMQKGRRLIGLDASMSALMRPALYGAYHHISLPYAAGRPEDRFDVVGSLCETMDRFASDRMLPEPQLGDLVLVHDTGAHGHAMGFSYNGRLRPAELLLTAAGDVVEIRRAENVEDYLATARWQPEPVLLHPTEAVHG